MLTATTTMTSATARPPAVSDFRSRNADEIVDYVGRSLAPHGMDMPHPEAMDLKLRSFQIAQAHLVDIAYGADVAIEAIDLDSHFLIHAAMQGRTSVWGDGVEHFIQPDNLYISCPGQGTRIRMTRECRHLTVRIASCAFEDYLTRCMHIPASRPVRFRAGSESGRELPQVWRNLLSHIITQLEIAPALMASPQTQRQYATVMVDLLLNHYPNSYSDQLSLHGNDITPWHVRRARDIIHGALEDTISVTDLAMQVGVSVRSLQNGFRQFLGLTPVEYVRRHRLEQLHTALSTGDPQSSITVKMLDCGITNFGRYAQYYRKQYGCSPSETLRNRRSTLSVPS
ncbi:AraC family transcriptional regulator [Novosphingobium kaempferiae]|uniref:AraC family transcriptional regulator n=1 Tax=Novosphingobium kaempferiae TaxID=2896849 RepID=UPI001E2D2921|nr:AraC family transcriptional regulator [Novosphingobium kaempferiae]